jgi:hypothetical protein
VRQAASDQTAAVGKRDLPGAVGGGVVGDP